MAPPPQQTDVAALGPRALEGTHGEDRPRPGADALAEDPLFPDVLGTFVSKYSAVTTLEQAAVRIGLPILAPVGGCHALRRGGPSSRDAGVEVWPIQALARHPSDVILAYIEGSHVQALINIAAEASLGRS